MLGRKSSFTNRLLGWFRQNRRDLPWRAPLGELPDPYRVLVSETMLQQTQVTTVTPFFQRFLDDFPTIERLADADEQQVLRLWQGLGYYSRARNLLEAARTIVHDLDARIPDSVQKLGALPGIGRYTAGAIASLAFDRPAPILDGNVARVLCRLDRIESDPRDPNTRRVLWRRAEELLPSRDAGDFNSALMELGATVCTPRAPKCLLCPVRNHCQAFAAGMQERLPLPRRSKLIPLLRRRIYCIRRSRRGNDEWLLEQRPRAGRWGNMWQFITRPATEKADAKLIGRKLGAISHALTHRRYRFDVFVSDDYAGWRPPVDPAVSQRSKWLMLERLSEYPLPRPHVIVAQMLRERMKPPASAPRR